MRISSLHDVFFLSIVAKILYQAHIAISLIILVKNRDSNNVTIHVVRKNSRLCVKLNPEGGIKFRNGRFINNDKKILTFSEKSFFSVSNDLPEMIGLSYGA